MSDGYTLVIGDKRLSSWSLRPWLAMTHVGVEFTEDQVRLDRPDTQHEIVRRSPSGRVPCLIDGDNAVWESLAILEYLAERHPEKELLPKDAAARARVRSVSAEMHAGFEALRALWPMKFDAFGLFAAPAPALARDLHRIETMWADCRTQHADAGPFLFGAFTIADAMYAPVVSRFKSYGHAPDSPAARDYAAMMWELPAMQEWLAGAKAESAGA